MESSVRREVVLPEEREAVWQALTEPERLGEWFASEVELDLRPGGAGVFRWGDGSARVAVVEEVEPERRLALRWRDEAGREPETLVELTLEEVADGTRVVVVETVRAPEAFGEWSGALALRALAPVHAGKAP